jgi:hypothetical protein
MERRKDGGMTAWKNRNTVEWKDGWMETGQKDGLKEG